MFYLTQTLIKKLKPLHLNDQVSWGGSVDPPAGLFMHIGTQGGKNQQVTHESPPHNSQLVTLKLRDPPTLAWQEFERGYE